MIYFSSKIIVRLTWTFWSVRHLMMAHSPRLCGGGPSSRRSRHPRRRRCSLAASPTGSGRGAWRRWGRPAHRGTSWSGTTASSASAESSAPRGVCWDGRRGGGSEGKHWEQTPTQSNKITFIYNMLVIDLRWTDTPKSKTNTLLHEPKY